MIFSSYPFLLGFLPAVYVLFLLLRSWRMERMTTACLLAASLVFYGAWNWHYLGLLLGSLVGNYLLGQQLVRSRRRYWLVLAIVGNLAVLGYFKYAAFFFGFLPGLEKKQIVLPLAISFFTFQQIVWHCDLYRRRLSDMGKPLDYALFICFFPHLIAGPIVHARKLLPQIAQGWSVRPLMWQLGATLLALGLMKKILLADAIAPGVDALFFRAESGGLFSIADVLLAGFSYGLQLYFDFSGYADMATGLALMFGIKLSINFRSPYKSLSVVEFWRRWHITLSSFLRDYLYIPLGGSHKGRVRQMANLLVTMLLGGLWHGAGWQFVFWGGLHGILLSINHAWSRKVPGAMPRIIALPLTLLVVMLAWIPFRAASLSVAMERYNGLLRWHLNWSFDPVSLLEELAALHVVANLPWVCIGLLAVALWGPGSRQLCLRLGARGRGLLVGIGMFLVLKALAGQSDRAFLYFNF
jgi:D-alanyl-lipoteichoic acid acyltransferase DltB (MBOAT superfamily)